MKIPKRAEWRAELPGYIEPYKELVLVDVAGEEKPYFELRMGKSGIMLAPLKLNDFQTAGALIMFFTRKAKFKSIKEREIKDTTTE